MRWWSFLVTMLAVALTVMLALVVQENRRLRQQIERVVREKARASGLQEGRVLEPFTLRDATGSDVRVDLRQGTGTVLLFHAASCDACEASRSFWCGAIEQAGRPDVSVLCIQTDVVDGSPIALEGLPPSLAVPLPPVGWLAALPAVPATLVVDGNGALARAWYSELDAEAARALALAISELGMTEAAAASPR